MGWHLLGTNFVGTDLIETADWMLWMGVGALVGLTIGWATWRRGWVADRRRTDAELAQLRAERASLRRRIADAVDDA